MIKSTSQCILRRPAKGQAAWPKQWNYHNHDIDNDNDKKDNM